MGNPFFRLYADHRTGTIDSSYHQVFNSLNAFDSISSVNHSFIIKDSTTYNEYEISKKIATYFDSYSTYLRDRNCATLVIDNYFNTQYIVK